MSRVNYDYALIRFVPCVRRGEFINIGVVLHAPAAHFLAGRFRGDVEAWVPPQPLDRVSRYVASLSAIANGEADGGALAQLSRSERFHWLTAPRSDMFQSSPAHAGRATADELAQLLEHIFAEEVLPSR